MATLESISNKVNTLQGDMNYRRIMDKGLDYLEQGRRAGRDFIVKTNMRTLKSGPNRGKVRVDGAVLVMFGIKNRSFVQTAIVRNGSNLLNTLDEMASTLDNYGE